MFFDATNLTREDFQILCASKCARRMVVAERLEFCYGVRPHHGLTAVEQVSHGVAKDGLIGSIPAKDFYAALKSSAE